MNRRLLAAAAAAGLGAASLIGTGITFADYVGGQAALERGDTIRALEEFRRAAEAGDPRAQFRLGQFYERGDHVLQDFVIAHMWHNLAAAQGHAEAASARDALAARMTPEQLARAQDLAQQRLSMTGLATAPRSTAAQGATAPITTSDIEMVQRRLNALGYQAGTADGVAGPRTRTALRAWQADVGLPRTGEVDRAAVERLASAPPPPRGEPAPQMTQAERVKLVQTRLKAAGYDPGPADGVLGSRTRAAIGDWQRANGMPVTGEVSSSLLASLEHPRVTTTTTTTTTTTQRTVGPQKRGGEADLAASDRLPPYVSDIQAELARHGYFRGEADGRLTDRLRGAIREYEEDAGLTVTGQVSEDLLDHLKFSRPEVIKQQRAGAR